MMGHHEKMQSGDEFDAIKHYVYKDKAGVRTKIKRAFNKRTRKAARRACYQFDA